VTYHDNYFNEGFQKYKNSLMKHEKFKNEREETDRTKKSNTGRVNLVKVHFLFVVNTTMKPLYS
jgi:hypothetical protein